MRLYFFQFVSCLLAIKQVDRVCAHPTTPTPTAVSVVTDVPYHPELSERAPKKEVPVYKESGSATWRGSRAIPSLFGISLTKEDVIQYAKDTYNSIKSKTTNYTLLLSVMYIPGKGLAMLLTES
jgi:hypothetical protein